MTAFCMRPVWPRVLARALVDFAAGGFAGGVADRPAARSDTCRPTDRAQKVDTPPPAPADQIGSGGVKVGLLLPLTQASGGASVVGVSMRNAAELALPTPEATI